MGNVEKLETEKDIDHETSINFYLRQDRRRFFETSVAFTIPLIPFNN